MNTGASVRSVREFNWPLVDFIAAIALVIVASLAAVQLSGPRLPVGAPEGARIWLQFEVEVMVLYAGWIALPRPDRMRHALERVLPICVGFVGMCFSGLVATVWLNFDAPSYQPIQTSLSGTLFFIGGCAAFFLLGKYIREQAVTNRLRREANSSHRSAWFAEVTVDNSWRRPTAITYGLCLAPFMLLLQLILPWSSLPSILTFAMLVVVTVAVGDRVSISITDAAVKVRTCWLSGNDGWAVSLTEISTVEVIAARPRTFMFDRNRCILRTGAALQLRTITGGRYAVSLESADEAMEVLSTLRAGSALAMPETPATLYGR